MVRDRELLALIADMKAQCAEEIAWERKSYSRLTQTQFGKKCGLSQGDISDVLRGRLQRFTLDRLLMILARFGHRVKISVC